MNYPYHSMAFGLLMMAILTVLVLSFTNDSENNCKGNSNGFEKCMQLMNGMKSLIYFSWPIYIGGMVGLRLYVMKQLKNTKPGEGK